MTDLYLSENSEFINYKGKPVQFYGLKTQIPVEELTKETCKEVIFHKPGEYHRDYLKALGFSEAGSEGDFVTFKK